MDTALLATGLASAAFVASHLGSGQHPAARPIGLPPGRERWRAVPGWFGDVGLIRLKD